MQHLKQIFFEKFFHFFAKTAIQRTASTILYCKKIFLKRVFLSISDLVPKQSTSIHTYTIVLINSHTSQLSLFFSFFFFLFCFSLPRETGIPFFCSIYGYIRLFFQVVYTLESPAIRTYTRIRIYALCTYTPQKESAGLIHNQRKSNHFKRESTELNESK